MITNLRQSILTFKHKRINFVLDFLIRQTNTIF